MVIQYEGCPHKRNMIVYIPDEGMALKIQLIT